MKKIKFSLVGCGRIGQRHAEHITNLGEMVAACDVNSDALQEFAQKFPNVKLHKSIEEMLSKDKESQVVNICTPNGLHAEHTIMAFRKDKHVVCEKPMALQVKDAKEMIKESVIAQKHLFIVKQNRFNPPIQKLKYVIDNNILGKIYSAQLNCFWNRSEQYYHESDWKGTKELDGGILYTQFSHFIDLLLWMLGDIVHVKAWAHNYQHQGIIEFEDTLVAMMEFSNGVLGTMNCSINSFQKNMEGSITLFGEKGTVKVGGQYLNVLEYQKVDNYIIEHVESVNKANDYGHYQGSMSNHDKVIENVIDVIKNNAKIAVNAYDGLKTLENIHKIYCSINKK